MVITLRCVYAVLVFYCIVGCAPRANRGQHRLSTNATPELQSLHYLVRVSDPLSMLRVKLCFSGMPPGVLIAGGDDAVSRLIAPQSSGILLRLKGSSLQLGDLERNACVTYSVDLQQRPEYFSAIFYTAHGVVIPSSVWLWVPPTISHHAEILLTLDLPSGLDASAPWELIAHAPKVYRIKPSTIQSLGHLAIGHFAAKYSYDDGNTHIDAVELDGGLRIQTGGIERWLRQGVRASQLLQKSDAIRNIQFLLIPVGPGSDPVSYGRVGRAGGASVMLLVRSNASEASLLRDWTLPHELAHLTLPYLDKKDAWLTEGFATYYQEVLLARVGTISPLRAWQAIDDGFRRGALVGTGRTLEEESRDMRETHAFWRVYWAGAVFALEADVWVRTHVPRYREDGIDGVLREVYARWRERQETWSGERFCSEMDKVVGGRPFSALATLYKSAQRFPDLHEIYEVLGLRREKHGRIALDKNATGARVRDAIMSTN